jgi:hypothetical protein
MRTTVKFAVAVLIGLPLTGVAQDQLNCVNEFTYSKEFIAKFPKAPAACNEVKLMKGEKWARFNAEVNKVEGDRLTITFTDKKKKPVTTMTFSFDPEATVTTEKDEIKEPSKLKTGDKLKVWMPESRVGLYAKPGESMISDHFALVGREPTKE